MLQYFIKVALSFPINLFPKNIFKEISIHIYIYIFYNKCFLWRNLCWIWKKNNNTILVFPLSNSPQVPNIFYDWPVKYYFLWFWYMTTRIYDRVQLSIYSTIFHKYFVAMTYRWICIFFIWTKVNFLREYAQAHKPWLFLVYKRHVLAND